ncbi:MAG: aminopeptidase [Bacteroidaceae bacterium]|nr:aminopeptidase [Bacteroidaceae bacterium]
MIKRALISLLLLFLVILPVFADELDDLLYALPGVSSVQTLQSEDNIAKRLVMFEQPVDANDASKGTFLQRIVLKHRGFDRPTVIVTEGYSNEYALHPRYTEELSDLLEANTLMVEHRYNGASSPLIQRGLEGKEQYSSTLWEYLTVENSAYDYHHIRVAFGEIYPRKWFSTGISKGGQTALFYRVFFPDDVVANVSYVAPLNKAIEDGRHETFLQQVGSDEVREKLLAYQRATLKHREEIVPMLERYSQSSDYEFRVPADEVFDLMVLEYPFAFWQWGDDVSTVPDEDADAETLWGSLRSKCEPNYFSRNTPYTPFNVQAMREIGYYGYDVSQLEGLLVRPTYEGYMRRVMIQEDLDFIEFKGDLYERCQQFLREKDIPAMFIYGEVDPWSATRVVLPGKKKRMYVFIQPEGSHRTRIATMPDDTRKKILRILKKWAK